MAGETPEPFEPIKAVETKGEDIKDFEVDMAEKNLGELAKDSHRLELYLGDQQDLINKHLKSFKDKALDKYTGILTWDNEEAVNRAMDQYAQQMNALLKRSVSRLLDIAEGIDDEDIHAHYADVKEKFGVELEKMIIDDLNKMVANIIENATLPTVAEKTKGIMSDIRSRKQMLEDIGKGD